MQTELLLTDHQAAELLQCSRAALVRFRYERRGPPWLKVGKLVRYRRTDLLSWLEERLVAPDRSGEAG
jgi:predicted DNA-binding transcriptional regulator AlpA